jgi:hypothetical protein
MNGEEYEFYIDVYSPKSIPMARLAAYLTELAMLLGNRERVHFSGLKEGSTRVLTMVEREAVPKVRARLQNAADKEAPEDIRKPFSRIDEMLREDNAIGRITRGNSNVIRFPGREAVRPPRMGPFTQQGEIDGVLVRIGGQDSTAHAMIEAADGKTVSCFVSRELAIQMAPYIYGTPLRLSGSARWERTESGEWSLINFRAKEFHVLNAESFSAVVGRLRSVAARWKPEDDPLSLIKELREADDEAP